MTPEQVKHFEYVGCAASVQLAGLVLTLVQPALQLEPLSLELTSALYMLAADGCPH